MSGLAKTLQNVNLEDFDIHPERGFLPSRDPRNPLSITNRSVFAQEALALPGLLEKGVVREMYDSHNGEIYQVDEKFFRKNRQALDEAMRYFSFMGSAYIYQPGCKPSNIMPAGIAVPLCKLAKILERPPILSYASYALYNWYRIDPSRPIELGNIAVCQNFLGGPDEDGFILIHVDIEARMGPVPGLCFDEIKNRAHDRFVVGQCLGAIARCQKMANQTMARMPEVCDPRMYYTRVRPFLHGWKGEQSPLPNGVIYEGVEEFRDEPQKFYGETGAQSSVVPTLYAYLGIMFEEDDYLEYLRDMRNYMPVGHRNFLVFLDKINAEHGTLRDFIVKTEFRSWIEAYNECIDLLVEFLEPMHLKYAKKYIADQTETPHNPTKTGTGGSKFMEFLSKHIETVKAHKIS